MKLKDIRIGIPVFYYSKIEASGKRSNAIPTIITSRAFSMCGDFFCDVDCVSGSVLVSHLEKRLIGKKLNKDMKAKVVEGYHGFGSEERNVFMILIKKNMVLLADGKPYWTLHREEAEAKAGKLNEKFSQL